MKTARLALVGDFNPEITAHRAINESAKRFAGTRLLALDWIGTEKLVAGNDALLSAVDGIWCVPASPYRSMDGALRAIECARTRLIPFLGTCGGYQHALLEFARNVPGLTAADHQESLPQAAFPLLTPLACPLVEKQEFVVINELSKLQAICGGMERSLEKYHCRYGLNPAHERLVQGGALMVAARSEQGEVRGVEIREHPFYFAVAYQPERRALEGELHPLVEAFFRAAISHATRNQTVFR